ncbi:MAG TPA: hypothetical protein VLV15_11685, partial [Dongiaceae bacterium]|nr:hypothetical protein [Dongiaceae bacterium]
MTETRVRRTDPVPAPAETPADPGVDEARFGLRDARILGLVLLSTAWVQRHALGAFFSSPDDLIHLQQAAGLKPTLATPFRFLSQVLYFRMMYMLVGPNPRAFHLVTYGLHLVNVVLVYALARSFGVRRVIAGAAAGLFGAFPLFLVLLSSGVGMNDELALTLAIAALLVLERPGRAARVAASALFTLAMICKESVLFLPLLALVPRGGATRSAAARRVAPLLVIAACFAILFFVLRPSGLAPDRVIYAMQFGPNLFHNLMTYLCW